MNSSTSFKASVDPSVIRNAPAFFDNDDNTIFRELLQNSRRAGAARIDINVNASRYSFQDDGAGCDPRNLLVFGGSKWRRAVREAESPAGMGFFSLARRHPTVTCHSRGWRIQLEEGHFTGELLVEIEMVAVDESRPGLLVEFDRPQRSYYPELPVEFRRAIRYVQMDVYFGGTCVLTRQDVFEEARRPLDLGRCVEYVDPTTGLEVQVIVGKGLKYAHKDDVCREGVRLFYGNHCVALEDVKEGCVELEGRKSTDERVTSAVRVKVTDEAKLPLELPQRNKVVRTEALEALLREARMRALALVASAFPVGPAYHIPFWVRARRDGYTGACPSLSLVGRRVLRAPGVDVPNYSYDVAREDDYYGQDDRIEDPAYVDGGAITLRMLQEDAAVFSVPEEDEEEMLRALVNAPTGEDELYFAPGVSFVRLHYVALEDEELRPFEFARPYLEARELLASRAIGEYLRIIRRVGGEDIVFDSRVHSWGSAEECPDTPAVCESIRMELYSPDAPDVATHAWDLPAYFYVGGSGNDDIGMMFTRPWLDGFLLGRSDFDAELVEFAKHHRDWWDHMQDENEEQESTHFYERTEALLRSYGDLKPFLRSKFIHKVDDVLERFSDLIPRDTKSVTITFDLDRQRYRTVSKDTEVSFLSAPQGKVATAEEVGAH